MPVVANVRACVRACVYSRYCSKCDVGASSVRLTSDERNGSVV